MSGPLLALDIFGNYTPMEKVHHGNESHYQVAKRRNNYGLATDMRKTCRQCRLLIKKICNGKNYYKCRLIGCSNCTATDVKLKCVCDKFEPEVKN